MKLSFSWMFTAMASFGTTNAAWSPKTDVLQFQENEGRPTVIRNYVPGNIASQLYKDLREAGFPNSMDEVVHPGLVMSYGHANSALETPPLPHEALDQVYHPHSEQSAVLRLEHMANQTYDLSQDLVNSVAPNTVMDDGGTIHLYVSAPGASALDNHTDTTDIFVLHLDGAKEWLLCKEEEEDIMDPSIFSLTHKLSSCSSYNKQEIDTLKCERTILYPGDALHLPMRVVHSAQAVSAVPSAHLTFGFPNKDKGGSCKESYSEEFILGQNTQRKLSCKRCDSSCDGECDGWNPWKGVTSCDHDCDSSCSGSSCDSGCDNWDLGDVTNGNGGWSSCDEGCDTCN